MLGEQFSETALWRDSLGVVSQTDPYAEQRSYLRTSYLRARDKAKDVASMIPEDHPSFTVHDISHLDALWGLAELAAGADIQLNPAEAFALGIAILVHDLGMTVAAYPNGLAELKENPIWSDTIISLLTKRLGHRPTAQDVIELEKTVEADALSAVLRENHAKAAENLVRRSWIDHNGSQIYLIEDSDFRNAFGHIIGRIAHSHWWSVSELREEFSAPPVGSATELRHPSEWTIDVLKLACLLRVADAIHLDARRAPNFLRLLRNPTGIAEAHWTFQFGSMYLTHGS